MAVPAEFIGGIVVGSFDEDLDRIVEAVKSRREQIRRKRMWEFSPGDRIVATGGKPGDGWEGLHGVFVKRRETKVLVRMDPGQRGRWAGREVVCPPDMIQKEDA